MMPGSLFSTRSILFDLLVLFVSAFPGYNLAENLFFQGGPGSCLVNPRSLVFGVVRQLTRSQLKIPPLPGRCLAVDH